MAVEPLVCTEDPGRADERVEDFRALFGKARTIERHSPQHLRLVLSTEGGLDISVLADERQCCGWFEFTLTPTADGTVLLDIRVPTDTRRVTGPAAEHAHAGTPDEILDIFAATAAEASGVTGGETHARSGAAPRCACC